MKIHATQADAYQLMHEGALALARAERQGIRVDTAYCARKQRSLTRQIDLLRQKVEDSRFYRRWKHMYGAKANISSNHQLSRLLYKAMKIEPPKQTETGQGATDDEALRQIDLPELQWILEIRRLTKLRDTYLNAFVQEAYDGYIHPSFNLHTVRTYRSCVAKGTRVLVVRDFIEHPSGIPIEDVCIGDYVYCFDNDLNPAIRQVKWAGKTGHREVIRVYYNIQNYNVQKVGTGYLDVTPEHLIRLVDGVYVQAQHLMGDFRNSGESEHAPKIRALSCRRVKDRLNLGNHTITKIEWIGKTVDVYDLEVEEFNNFFANETCVHNSSSDPNFQNIPKRDKDSMRTCRRALLPRPGHMFVEADFAALEVNISACYHKDPVMIRYLKDKKSDMHLDMAKQIFMFDELDRGLPAHNTLRQAAKNGFVFPQFYGDYYGNNAAGICEWVKLPREKWQAGQGIELPDGSHISDHFRSHKIGSFEQFKDHLQSVEQDFWGRRFRVYDNWRKASVEAYRRRGFLQMLTGFVCSGVMKKNEITNYPIQGTAFHCLLKTFIELDRIMLAQKWDSRLVGQIHDSIIMDVLPGELPRIREALQWIVKEHLPSVWDWIAVPLEIEIEEYVVDGPWLRG